MSKSTVKSVVSAFVIGAAAAAGAYYACKLLCSNEKFNQTKEKFENLVKEKIENCKEKCCCKDDCSCDDQDCDCDCDCDSNCDCNNDDCYVDGELSDIDELIKLDGAEE